MSRPAESRINPRADATGRHRRQFEMLEWLTVIHVAVFAIASAWAFGGQAEWVRGPLVAWGSLGCFITLAALLRRDARRNVSWHLLLWTLPLIAVNGMVLVASLNPSFQEIRSGTESFLAHVGGNARWPSSARPDLARGALWEFDAIWLSGFNLVLVIRRRHALRGLLVAIGLNALVLAILGTVQKLGRAPGLFFGAVPSPQPYFFSSFVYHNHWGAYTLLCLAVWLALIAHSDRCPGSRRPRHSPAATGAVIVLILAATLPLSASRSSTLLATGFLGASFLHWLTRQVRQRRHFNESFAPPAAAAIVAVGLGVAGVAYLARDTIVARSVLTLRQVEHAQAARTIDPRLQLYRDTWEMAGAKPWFGWGMASYPYVFTMYNTRTSPDRLPVFYHDAHNDWLQALAEHGLVGTALFAACALVPIALVRRQVLRPPLTGYLLAGCGLVLLYAGLEFPFGNFAVMVTWWLCFFTAIQYSRLSGEANRRESPSTE